MTYESSKQLLTTFGGDGTHSNPLAVLVAGGLCGIVSWALICEIPFVGSLCCSELTYPQIRLTLPRASTSVTLSCIPRDKRSSLSR